jgi:hypothetical protein
MLRLAASLFAVSLAAAEGPCDIYDAAKEGTPCVAAHSTVRVDEDRTVMTTDCRDSIYKIECVA